MGMDVEQNKYRNRPYRFKLFNSYYLFELGLNSILSGGEYIGEIAYK